VSSVVEDETLFNSSLPFPRCTVFKISAEYLSLAM
jgi:hypothetical protein